MMCSFRLPRWVLCALLVAGASVRAEPITTGTLISEMIDLKRLGDFPKPFYHTVQFSSYDHRSQIPGGANWFGNADGFGGDPIPNFESVLKKPDDQGTGEYVICDVKGPGAIVRVWTAEISGTVRLTLDDAAAPLYDGPADPFFRATYPALKVPGVDEQLFEGTFAQQNAGYFPIPFARHCQLIWKGKLDETHFYQIQIRQYEPGAQVTTFRAEDLSTYADAIKKVAKVLANPEREWPYTSRQQSLPIQAKLAAGKRQEVLKVEGPAAIERLLLKVTAKDMDRALRQTLLLIYCDDYPHGQVQSPIGDFFGAAPGINPYESVPFTVGADGTMICRYVMPFAKVMRIVVENRGEQEVILSGSAMPVEYTWDPERSMHFRARWRVNHGVTGTNSPPQDMPYLIANGAGVYVGTALMLMNLSGATHPSGSWWGEGDEKIFVDSDVRPSTFGTGSEDYFNYAWSIPDIFLFPYCGQPRDDGPANRGFVTNDRWHIIDCLPFQQRLSFYMELFCHGTVPGMSYARIAYHYGRPGLMDDHVLITDEDLRHLELPPNWQPIAFRGSANSVFWQAEDLLVEKDHAGLGSVSNNLWSGGKLLTWKPTRAGEELSFKFPAKEKGKYALHLTLAQMPDSGSISVQVDGKKAGFGGKAGVIELAVPFRTLSRVFDSSALELEQGDHTITLHAEGDEGKIVGLDFFYLQKR